MALLIPPPNQEFIAGKNKPTQWWVNWFNAVKKKTDSIFKKATPTSTADNIGIEGDSAYDDNYIYIKTNAGWKRVALSSF